MLAFVVTTALCFITYLLLTTGSGTLGLWSLEEILFGAILSLIVGFLARTILVKDNFRMANPVRWVIFMAYVIGPFFCLNGKSKH